ncbi:phospholipid carrier-dependent glycosyltransferase [Planctomicrobium piriforme]|uniref:Dolichyl-phosphate-mannose-protein mannosyltransferase n=1 Tax=Planctomicrobium piriforme TaxID=1576369 RepID=A0A1I3KTP4_9PLAN|nr:phospholipid carrier-dependent glycosyltransferase [Planctomicrobium piriforme]SFI75485.1 Dolichyl-phosphate-mannose-protein mannosyltransferase [Planctomicrobium piriforme]
MSRDSITLLVLLAVAFALRAWNAAHMSVEHFDEGVYAANLFSNGRYPFRELYAPPLLPAVLEWTLIFSATALQSVMWVNVVLGTALVAAVWWTTRELSVECRVLSGGRVESPESRVQSRMQHTSSRIIPDTQRSTLSTQPSLIAATLVAFSDIFIQYSRAALTDVPVCLWITLAVGAGVKWFRSGSRGWLAGACVATALAWWTKYNGWLPLAILGAGAGGWIVFSRPDRTSSVQTLFRWGLVAVGAFLLWFPCLNDLQQYGGYAAVSANHAGYVVGLSGWIPSALRHLEVDRFYTCLSTACGLGLAAMLALSAGAIDAGSSTRSTLVRLVIAAVVAALIATVTVFTGSLPVLGILAAAGLSAWPAPVGQTPEERQSSQLGRWILAAWIIGLLVATPTYRPYPRLILPLLTALSIGAGVGISVLAGWFNSRLFAVKQSLADGSALTVERPWTGWLAPVFVCLAGVTAVAGTMVFHPSAWQDRRGLEWIAGQIIVSIQKDLPNQPPSTLNGVRAVIYVAGEPALFDHLSALSGNKQRFVFLPTADFSPLKSADGPRVPTYLVSGPHVVAESADGSPSVAGARLIDKYEYRPSDLVLLDEHPPAVLKKLPPAAILLWTQKTP